jgi:hypothetical protein
LWADRGLVLLVVLKPKSSWQAEWGLFMLLSVSLVALPLLLFRPPAPVDGKRKKL